MSANHIQSDHACEVEIINSFEPQHLCLRAVQVSLLSSQGIVLKLSVLRVLGGREKNILLQDEYHLSCACQKEYNPEA
jgi:hypothetical protein